MNGRLRTGLHSAILAAGLGLAGFAAGHAKADGDLVVYCSPQEEWCQLMVNEFQKATGINVSMTRKSSGETYAQVKAEAANPKGDIWWGGTGDPHLQAAEEDLTVAYDSPMLKELNDWAVSQHKLAGGKTVGIYMGALGFGYSEDVLKEKGVEGPKCWADLIKPEYKGEVQVANPNSSGTAYTFVATLVQIMGEEDAFAYLKKLNENVNQYTKSGAAPSQAASRGETLIGITFQHDLVTPAVVAGVPMKVISPCEGTGFEVGSMSIIKGAPNLENAKKWYDWALTPEAQALGAQANSFQVPSNKSAPIPEAAPKLSEIKLIDYDFAKYGSSDERKRLLSRWDKEIGAQYSTQRVAAGGGDEPPPVAVHSDMAVSNQQKRILAALLIAGAAGLALPPWYAIEDGFWSFAWLATYPDAATAPALVLAAVHGTPWLWPLFLALALPLPAVFGHRSASALVLAGGAFGISYLFLQGFLIGIRGWSVPALEAMFGPVPPQEGLGAGGLVAGTVFLLMIAAGLARRGAMRGDMFLVGSITLVVASILLFVFFPVAEVLLEAAVEPGEGFSVGALFERLTVDDIWSLGCFAGRSYCGVFWNSLWLAVATGITTTLLGLAFALLHKRTGFRAKGLLRLLAILPIITPPFVIGLGIILLFGRSGVATVAISDLFGIPPSRWIYGFSGLLLVQTLAFAPIAYLILIGVVDGISPSMEEAAQTLRADRWRTFRTVTWPLLRPGLANAFLIGFVESLADFGNPLVLGGNFDVLSTDIFFAIVGSQNDPGRAAALSIVLLSLTLGAFVLQRRWLGRRSYTTISGKGDSGIPPQLPRRLTLVIYLVTLPWLAFTILLYLLILVGGFVRSLGLNNTPTFQHYVTAFGVEWGPNGLLWTGRAWPSFVTTLELAAIAAPLTAGIGLLTAYLLNRQNFFGKNSFEFMTMLSFAIPGTVIGVSYIIAFNVPPIELTGTGLILIICFVFRNMPVSIRAGLATLTQIDKSLDECSLTLRHGSFATVRRVIVPLLRPAIVASLVYSFVRAITSVSAVIFLVSAQYNLATAYIVGRVEISDFGVAIAYSSVLIVCMLAAIGLIQFGVGEQRRGRRGMTTPAPLEAAS